MRTLVPKWLLLVVFACGTAAGCGSDDAQTGSQTPVAVEPRSGPAETADKAVLAVKDGLNDNHPEAVWDFLPASYQHDLDDLVHTFARRVDAELWSKGMTVFRKLVTVLKTKKAFLAADMTTTAGLIEILLEGDVGDLEKLKSFDGRRFLAGTGARLFGQLRTLVPNLDAQFDFKKVTLLKSKGDAATVELKTDQETIERDFVRVDGKWIPQDLAEGWLDQIGNARARLSTFLSPDILAESKPQILSMLAAADEVLDRLVAAGTQEEFRAGLAEADVKLGPYKALIASWLVSAPSDASDTGPAADEEPVRNEPIEFVTVVVTGMLDDDAQDALRARLNAVADDRDRAESEITGDEETTTIKVGPVSDIAAFAQRLDFLKIDAVDAKTRTITAHTKK
jgi:hypothetical protein